MKKKKNMIRYVSVFMILNIVFEVASPTVALALTNGPTQQEFLGFEPAGTTEMVDLFTGDFKYNIPLLDVDGYPLNLSYKAGAGMESEASWVGLGWSLNPGVLNRVMKGLPDDFNGDEVNSELNIKPIYTSGSGKTKSSWSGFGFSLSYKNIPICGYNTQNGIDDGKMLIYNNYKGYGIEESHDSHSSVSQGIFVYSTNESTGDGENFSSQSGGSFSTYSSKGNGLGFGFSGYVNNGTGTNYNTRTGEITQTTSQNATFGRPGFLGAYSRGSSVSSSLPAGSISYAPKIPFDLTGANSAYSDKNGLWARVSIFMYGLSGGDMEGYRSFISGLRPNNAHKKLKSYGYLYSQNADSASLMDFNRFRDEAIHDKTPHISSSTATYDLFLASAQGMNSSFRPFRSDISCVKDPEKRLTSSGTYSGYETGMPVLVHKLEESSNISIAGLSKNWQSPFLKTLKHDKYDNLVVDPTAPNLSANASKALVEGTYFKEMGELTARDEDYEASIKADKIVTPVLLKTGEVYTAYSPISGAGRQQRDKRNTYIECLSASQAAQYGFEKKINLYSSNTFSINPTSKLVAPSTLTTEMNIERQTKNSPLSGTISVKDHISEVSMTNASGSRYVYGIPAYNLLKKTVSFNASTRKEGSYVQHLSSLGFSNISSYSISPLNISEPCQFVQYDSSDVNANRRGLDNFRKTDEFPAYASSFLLTSILSPDYVDVTGNGPSYDDLGSFTKFNYSKASNYQWRQPFCVDAAASGTIAGGISTASAQAYYDKGLICDFLDDKGYYEYGIRENYYVHSIESKNYVAVFKTSPRSDAMGVMNEGGVMGTSGESLKLDAIELYSKNEILRNGGINGAIPLKVVHFEYDYSLCPSTFNTLSTDNPTRAKLTLKKVYFTYGTSKKSALSPYEFFYADNDHNALDSDPYTSSSYEANFKYEPKSVDRWGSYKPNINTAVGGTTFLTLNNTEFPYAEQDKTLADLYAAAWNLTKIKTPSGSTIKITYESDDYSYVQNKPVSQMCKIYNGFSGPPAKNTDVRSTYNATVLNTNSGLIIDLSSMSAGIPSTLSLNSAETQLKKTLFGSDMIYSFDPLQFYFKCFLKLAGPETSSGLSQNYFDFINGYATTYTDFMGLYDASIPGNTYIGMNSSGTGTVSCYRFAYVLPYPSDDEPMAGPIAVAGWEFLRNYAPRIAYPGSEPANMGGAFSIPSEQHSNAETGLAVAKTDLENSRPKEKSDEIPQPNKRFYDNGFCSLLYPGKSFIRLYSLNHKKLGGGHRVKRIVTQDNWGDMTNGINGSGYSETGTEYVQEFEYLTRHSVSQEIISSGVASYEPLVGGDENSLRQPIHFTIEKTFAPNDHFFQEEPLGELMYPAPLVGYSKVTVRNISDRSVTNVAGVGKMEFEFYTAKDFPIIDITSQAQRRPSERIPEEATLTQFIRRLDNPDYEAFKILHVSEGYVLKLNDMHGKLRSISVFGEDNPTSPVAKTEYFYATESGGLASKALVMDRDNGITTKVISRDIDVTAEARENITQTDITGQNTLFEWGLAIYPIVPSPFIWISPDLPTFNENEFISMTAFGYRGATLTKVVQEYGILEKIETTYNGSKTTTENMIRDANTGEVILTRVKNEQDQPIYNFNYPAHWAYPEMSSEFKRDGLKISCPAAGTSTLMNYTTGNLDLSGFSGLEILKIGDEVAFWDITSNTKIGDRFWLFSNPADPSKHILVDQNGGTLNTSYGLNPAHHHQIRIIRPINRNILNASMGAVSSLNDPRDSSTINYTLPGQKIIDAYALEYCSGKGVFFNENVSQQNATNVPASSYGMAINPIITGYYGAFKPAAYYKHQVNRSYGTQPNIKQDGLYASFDPFWKYGSGEWRSIPSTSCAPSASDPDDMHGNWKQLEKNMYYSPYGQLMESRNAIGVYSSQRFGFNHTLLTLNAINAHANEVGFDSFEEYQSTQKYLAAISPSAAGVFNNDHLGFFGQGSLNPGGSKPYFSTAAAHTGKTSLLFGATQSVTLNHFMSAYPSGAPLASERPKTIYNDDNICHCSQINDAYGCSKMALQIKPYVVSMWVKGLSQAADYSNLVSLSVTQTYTLVGPPATPSVSTVTYTPVKSAIINGWQKLDYEIQVSVPPGGTASAARIALNISAASNGFYLDDFRIQPFNSTMVCNVYDPYQMRLCAQLDDRNYATIYEYDQEGMLVRKKKETQSTIYTINETRTGKPKR